MAEADHTECLNVLNSSSVARGVTAGETPPNGGGSFVYGMASKVNTEGAVALYTNLTNFAPSAKGANITMAMKKGGGGGNSNHAPFIFACLQSTDVNAQAYMLGLSKDDPSYIVLRKGTLITGIPDSAVGTNGVLARSTASKAVDEWVHLRLEVVVNTSGDVVLNVYENDLSVNAVTSPSWAAITGMSGFSGGSAATATIDDALGVNSGSLPFTSGRHGFGAYFSDISRACYFDHLTLARQL